MSDMQQDPAQEQPVDIDGDIMERLDIASEFEHQIIGRPDFSRLSTALKPDKQSRPKPPQWYQWIQILAW